MFGLLVCVPQSTVCETEAFSTHASRRPQGHWFLLQVPLGRSIGPASPAKGAVRVYLPAGLNPSAAHTVRAPLVVALHGWNGKAEDWDRPEITGIADRFGLILACPSMGRTVYESRFYPETRARWGPMPGAVFLTDVLLPFLRTRLPVRHDRSGTAIIGVSTGGRGAVVAALRSQEFGFVASLSGTYALDILDPRSGEYAIHAAVFGPRSRFKKRWGSEDVVTSRHLKNLATTRLYLAHSGNDTVVPWAQLRAFEQALRAQGIEAQAQSVLEPEAGHTWSFWLKHIGAALSEFARSAQSGTAQAPRGSVH